MRIHREPSVRTRRWNRLRVAALMTTGLVPVCAATAAWAETDAGKATAGAAQVEEVVVTGSRIARPDYTSPSPIVSVGQAAIKESGNLNVEGALNQLPQFVAGGTSTTNFPGLGISTIQLRGLEATRTLTLLNGRRYIGNITTIPSALIDNVEIISGGASATYGSDAIAGVVNFKLKRNFEGLTFDFQGGETERGDGLNNEEDITFGGALDNGRGHVAVAATRQWRDWSWKRDRDFSKVDALSTTLREGRIEINGTNLPSQAAVNTVFGQYGVAAGTVNRATAFGVNTDGSLFRQTGPIVNFRGVLPGVGGDNRYAFNKTGDLNWNGGEYTPLEVPLNLYSVFAKGDYDLTDHITAYGEAMFSHYLLESKQGAANAALVHIYTIPVTNPFIPADLKTLLASRPNPTAPFTYSKRLEAQPNRIIQQYNDTFQLTGGLRGTIPGRDWTWDVFAAYGEAQDKQVYNSANNANIKAMLAAADGGKSLCAGGYNPFGDQTYSADCIAFTSAADISLSKTSLLQVEGSIQGSLLKLPAGPLRFALGGDYRDSKLDTQPGPLVLASQIPNNIVGAATHGDVSVREVFGELLVPVFADLPFVKEFNVGLGYRYSDYDLSGGLKTYKVDLDWKVAAGLALRGSYQRAARAPTIVDLFSPVTLASPNIGSPGALGSGDPCDINGAYRKGPNAAQVRALCIQQGIAASFVDLFTNPNPIVSGRVSGNINLKPELSDTYTAGVVWRSTIDQPLLSNLQASVDYYDINVNGAIGSTPATTTLSRCFNATGTANPTYDPNNVFCTLIKRTSSGIFEAIQQPTLNLGGLHVTGVDTQVDWMLNFADFNHERWGTLRVNTVWSHFTKFGLTTLPGDSEVDQAGSIGGSSSARPSWKGSTTVTHDVGPFSASLKWRYISAMKDITAVGVANSTSIGTSAVNYFDLTGRYRARDNLTFRAGIINLLDKDPPFYNSAVQANTDPATFDVLGRRYFVGLTARF